jgi:hypothetical protein
VTADEIDAIARRVARGLNDQSKYEIAGDRLALLAEVLRLRSMIDMIHITLWGLGPDSPHPGGIVRVLQGRLAGEPDGRRPPPADPVGSGDHPGARTDARPDAPR